MNRVFLLILGLLSYGVWGFNYPQVQLAFLNKPPSVVYLNEVVKIPLKMDYANLAIGQYWYLPNGVSLEKVSGRCPNIPSTYAWLGTAQCSMNLVIRATQLGRVYSGALLFRVVGESKGYHWNYLYSSPSFSVQVIPHCPSMNNIPIQYATANQEFVLNLKPFIKYYDENNKGKTPVQPVVAPAVQDGLRYDAKQQALVGKPSHLGIYSFTIAAKNSRCMAKSVPLQINVKANPKDKPVFKQQHLMLTGIAKQKYSMNLLELLQTTAPFMLNNQVQFHIIPHVDNPPWLRISANDATRLEGIIPASSAGQNVKVHLLASSNTGGDSEPLTVNIPVAIDPSLQPKILPFTLEGEAGNVLDFELSNYITSPGNQSVDFFIDKVEPVAPWLFHQGSSLKGVIPPDAAGLTYSITMHASTIVGGSSKPINIPLQVAIDANKKPYFSGVIHMPRAQVGEAYQYDFKQNKNVAPADIPYQIELASDYPNPGWVNIKNNQLVIEQVPDIAESEVLVYLFIKNIPGGRSDIKKLHFKLFYSESMKH